VLSSNDPIDSPRGSRRKARRCGRSGPDGRPRFWWQVLLCPSEVPNAKNANCDREALSAPAQFQHLLLRHPPRLTRYARTSSTPIESRHTPNTASVVMTIG